MEVWSMNWFEDVKDEAVNNDDDKGSLEPEVITVI